MAAGCLAQVARACATHRWFQALINHFAGAVGAQQQQRIGRVPEPAKDIRGERKVVENRKREGDYLSKRIEESGDNKRVRARESEEMEVDRGPMAASSRGAPMDPQTPPSFGDSHRRSAKQGNHIRRKVAT